MWGTYRSLINNAVTGVSQGHEKILELNGVGFRANLKGEVLNLQIGFSHDVNFKIPKEIKITVLGLGYVGIVLANEFSKKYSCIGCNKKFSRKKV